jgi:hypothetical protein
MKPITQHIKLFVILLILTGSSWVLEAQNAWINEFHYDNVNADANEFVEIVLENPSSYNLSLFSVVLYNGSASIRAPYDTKTLNQFTPGSSTGNFTFYYYNYPLDGIQNGAPDGLALVYNGTVIPGQFLSYEGSFVALTGPAAGMTSVNIVVSESGTTPLGYSLQLSGTGALYSAFTWQPEATSTTGGLNNGQIIVFAGVSDPVNFDAAAVTTSQVDLTWDLNSNADSVIIAYNLARTFGTPSGSYPVGGTIAGGGTIIYKGKGLMHSHTGLTAATEYFYKSWSRTTSGAYSTGVIDSASTQSLEPSDQPSGLLAASNGFDHIDVSWNDADADHYLLKGSGVGYAGIVAPIDGIAQGDSLLVKNVNSAVQTYQFTGLLPGTTYFFKIYPYNGTGSASKYKTDGSIPQTYSTTHDLDLDLIISEVADPRDSSLAKFVEVYNTGTTAINLSSTPVYLCRQSNGGTMSSVRLTGTIAPGSAYVTGYVFSSADTLRFFKAYGFTPDFYSGLASGNGNDGYFLYYGGPHTSGVLFDSYGVLNVDGIGEAWEYTDKKAVRKRDVTAPNSTWTASEWVIPTGFTMAKDMTPGYHKGDVTWQGLLSTNWNARGTNWNSPHGYIPDASCNVTIPNTANYPKITEPCSSNKVQILSGSALGIQSTGSLLIVGQQ